MDEFRSDEHRQFDTGANRDSDLGKLDFEGFLSPLVLERYAQYLNDHRKLPDGTLRDSDNWQKGMSTTVYMKSGLRHVFDVWSAHRGYPIFNPKTEEPIDIEDAICAILFNFQGYLLELLHDRINSNTYEVDVAQTDPPEVVHSPGWEMSNQPVTVPTPKVEKGPLTLDENYLRPENNSHLRKKVGDSNDGTHIRRGTE